MSKLKDEKLKDQPSVEETNTELTQERELSPQEFEELNNSLDNFQESFLSFLAGTSQFEIIPTTDEFGNSISEKNLELIRRECKRLGSKVLYSVDCGRNVMLINPETLKIGIMANTLEIQ